QMFHSTGYVPRAGKLHEIKREEALEGEARQPTGKNLRDQADARLTFHASMQSIPLLGPHIADVEPINTQRDNLQQDKDGNVALANIGGLGGAHLRHGDARGELSEDDKTSGWRVLFQANASRN